MNDDHLAARTVGGGTHLSRRGLLRLGMLGAGAVAAPGFLSACAEKSTKTNEVTIGSRFGFEPAKTALANVVEAYKKKTGAEVKVNTSESDAFGESLNRYLQGTPDDVFTWFAGYRMAFFAKRGLAADISDIWQGFDGFSAAMKETSSADGKQYFVPLYQYPWLVFYRKSVWTQHGYAVPATFDEFAALGARMTADGIPIALGNKELWPAPVTFDYLNVRTNGFDFHKGLMLGTEEWTNPKVRATFDNWSRVLPFHQPDPNGRAIEEAANALVQKQAGMMVAPLHIANLFKPEEFSDLDFFPFPELDRAFGMDTIEAPIDGFMVAQKAKNVAAGKEFAKYLATPEAVEVWLTTDKANLAANSKATVAGYNTLQQRSAELIKNAAHFTQALDRDTRPDFAQTVVLPGIQEFLRKPEDIDAITKNIESQKKTIFATE